MSKHISPDQCIACTTCVVHCPVAEATPAFLGPRMIGPAYERFRLLGLAEDPSLYYCSNCKNCDISCPHNVPVSTFNMLARAEQCRKQRPPLRDWMLAHGESLARLLRPLPAWLKNAGMLNPLTRAALNVLGVAAKAPLPAFAASSFHAQFRRLEQPRSAQKVAFFPGCYVDIYDSQTGLDMVWALNQAGYEVLLPEEFMCCGLPMIANGFWQDARRNAERNMAALARCRAEGLPVLTGCPSCALMFKADLPEFFPELAAKEGEPGAGLADAQEFLLACVERGQWRLDQGPRQAAQTIIYHAPCHLRAQGLGLPGLELLRALPGVTAENADAGCCGISGSYGFKKEKYPIAMQVGAPLFEAVRTSKAGLAASECGTCRVQIRHGAGVECHHPVSLVRQRLTGGR